MTRKRTSGCGAQHGLRHCAARFVYRLSVTSAVRHKLNDALRLTQPIRVAHPVDEDAEFELNFAKQSQFF
jgi:hypothetical protein